MFGQVLIQYLFNQCPDETSRYCMVIQVTGFNESSNKDRLLKVETLIEF